MEHFTSQQNEQLECVKWPLSSGGSNSCILSRLPTQFSPCRSDAENRDQVMHEVE